MELLMLGLNHKTAPVDVRERFSIPKAAVKSGLANLGEYEGILEAVVLSTCNRSEMYAVVEKADRDLATLKQFLFDLTGNEENIDEYLYHYADEECIDHLFRVASSLDSLVLGEGQILSQVKEAYAMSREAGTTSTVLNTLFHRAIATGKRVRTETRIQFNSVSVSYAAVELAREALGELHEASALIFGAGKMAELTAQHLISHGVKKIYVTNRHIERAELLAAQFNGEAVPFEEAMKRAVDVDVIVTSTGAPHYVIKPWETRQLMTKRKSRQLFLIDIAVPRDVDPEVGEIKGVTLYNIDALEEVVDEHIEERRHEAKQAEKIVQEEVDSIMERFQYLSFRPLMARLSDRCERIRAREVKRASSKLPDLNEEQWRQVEHMSRMIVRKILRMPMMKLNSAAGTEQEEFYIEAMRALFKLDTIGETANSEEHDCYRYAQQ
ncbi:putative glutamyl-tRNA reductase [Selenomonas ruminantium subsp. lactilytica TAM6421]|uniref:Glutamyl-tRNA reductase n=1 Tax=Selenomonas ruminantium subsp. lactilytica (strain NBRC 103574 / TAM6421) TaxID=927704 RepID=I0GTK4_SELRL|nr:glutamyl-tRNA reductase [Selenomonas ruminantium]BAL84091.1 putative glutamyl-tRNA reductase [Selenomonas ruminantium subsp. lactilytica TAM6421]